MNTRSLLSGSSLRPLRASALPLAPLPASRRYITFPHPSLEVPKATNRITVRTTHRIPTLAHAYTILRAIERKLHTSVLFVQLPKNPDTLSAAHLIFLETATPVNVEEEMMFEIPAPVLSEESNFLGGPSLEDVRAALAVAPDARPSDAPLIQPKRNDSVVPPTPRRGGLQNTNTDVIQIQVGPTYEKRAAYRDPRVWHTRHRQGGGEVVRVLEAIQGFEGGFFGGFNGIVDGPRLKVRNDKFQNLDQGNGGRGKRQGGTMGDKGETVGGRAETPGDRGGTLAGRGGTLGEGVMTGHTEVWAGAGSGRGRGVGGRVSYCMDPSQGHHRV